jgi:predicted AlkP superfamily phosphohydrolase/phosphomutase
MAPEVRILSLLGLSLAAACGEPAARPVESPPPRVLLIGVDGATWHVARPMVERGELPHLARLMERGVHGDLLSMDPMTSPVLWTTIATGTVPDRHGILHFVQADPNTGKEVPVSSNLRRREALWTILTQRGRTTNVVGWYASWPAEAIRGHVVTDHLLPRAQSAFWPVSEGAEQKLDGRTYPPELLKELLPLVPTLEEVARLDRLSIPPPEGRTPEEERLARIFEPHRVDEIRFRAIRHLMARGDWDLSMVLFWGIDPMSHLFWNCMEPETWRGEPVPAAVLAANADRIPSYYRKIDGYLGRLVEQAGEDTVVLIVSDHGFGPGTARLVGPGTPLSGDHRKEGILVAAGGPIRRGVRLDGARIVDVTPTLLYLLGLPVGDDMEGRVIEGLFQTPLPRPIESIPSWERGASPASPTPITSPVDEDIREQLRALGYIR